MDGSAPTDTSAAAVAAHPDPPGSLSPLATLPYYPPAAEWVVVVRAVAWAGIGEGAFKLLTSAAGVALSVIQSSILFMPFGAEGWQRPIGLFLEGVSDLAAVGLVVAGFRCRLLRRSARRHIVVAAAVLAATAAAQWVCTWVPDIIGRGPGRVFASVGPAVGALYLLQMGVYLLHSLLLPALLIWLMTRPQARAAFEG